MCLTERAAASRCSGVEDPLMTAPLATMPRAAQVTAANCTVHFSVLSVCRITQVDEEVPNLVPFTDGELKSHSCSALWSKRTPNQLAPGPVVLRHLYEPFGLSVNLGLGWAPSSTHKGIGV